MRNIVYALWSARNWFGTTPQKEGVNPTSCPARRKTNMFPGRAGKTLSKKCRALGNV
jgi:hypothetical protein